MRRYHRKKLNKLLGAADDESFIQMLWALNALQSENARNALKILDHRTVPADAIATEIANNYAIHKWEMETLANELMTIPKSKPVRNGQVRSLNCSSFQAGLECVNALRKLENAEYRDFKRDEDVFVEMGRLAARQFDWQRGYDNVPQIYRNAVVYGKGESAKYFEQRYGISLNRFSQIGFMLFVSFTHDPIVSEGKDWSELGVGWDEVEKVLEMVAQPFSDAAAEALALRSNMLTTAYKPSVLRLKPCLRFGSNNERIRVPLPDLILERITSGVFYDVVGGGGAVRKGYGKRFEDYCAGYLAEVLDGLTWEREFGYRKKPNKLQTPDVLCSVDGAVSLAVECKATRMSHPTMFAAEQIAENGYDDMVKAVFQLWRFFSHCRRGYIDRTVAANSVGMVLTLDNWLVLADVMRRRVFEKASILASEKDPGIIEADKRPIIFVAIHELERVLSKTTKEEFLQTVKEATSERFQGWRLDSVYSELWSDPERKQRRYPYTRELGSLLPWWEEIERLGDRRGSR